MRIIVNLLILLAVLVPVYWFLLRPVLKQRAELAPFFAQSELLRAGWWAKLKLSLSGLKTSLFAKLVMLAGVIAPLLDFIGVVDWASILPPINITATWQLTPAQYVTGIIVPMIGWIVLRLRAITTTPQGVPSAAQVAAMIPEAPAMVVEGRAAEIAEAKAPPNAASGKE